MIATPILDDAQTTPIQGIAQAGAKWTGRVPNLRDWLLIAEYDVTEQAKQRHRLTFDKVFVFEAAHERDLRHHLGIDETKLDPIETHGAWWLQKAATTPATG